MSIQKNIRRKNRINLRKVGVLVAFMKDDEIYRFFRFQTDMNRLGQTISFCQRNTDQISERVKILHQELLRLSHTGDINAPETNYEDFQYMCTVVLNYICCFDFTSITYVGFSKIGAGIIIGINEEDSFSTSFKALDFNHFLRYCENVVYEI